MLEHDSILYPTTNRKKKRVKEVLNKNKINIHFSCELLLSILIFHQNSTLSKGLF